MPTTIKFRRGTTAQNDSFTGANGEITFDHELKELRIHDSVTQGGHIIRSTNSAASAVTTFGANVTFNATSTFNGTMNINGNVNVGDAAADVMNVTSTSNMNGNTTIGNANTDTLVVNARVASSLIPSSNVTYDLGSAEHSWRDLYLSGSTIRIGSVDLKDNNGSLAVVVAGTSTPVDSNYMSVANTQALHDSVTANLNSYIANTNPRIANILTSVGGTNTALRTLVSDRIQVANATLLINDRMQVANTVVLVNDRLQVANAAATYQTIATERAALANTNAFITTKLANAIAFMTVNGGEAIVAVGPDTVDFVSGSGITLNGNSTTISISSDVTTSQFNDALANTNAYIATKLDSSSYTTADVRSKAALANTNAYIGSVSATERSALANTNAYIATKANIASPTFTGIPAAPTAAAGTNTTQLATTAFVTGAITDVIDAAPTALNTLNELAAALGDDANFASTVTTNLSQRLGATASITLTGDVTGSGSFSANSVSITTTVADDSHNHIIGNVDGLQTALDAKQTVAVERAALANTNAYIATKLNSSSYTASDVLTKIKTVDGASSGLDADLLDGQQGTYYLDWTNVTNKPDPTITLGGDLSGSLTLTDLAGGTLTATVADDSHNHIVSNVDGLQAALDAKMSAANTIALAGSRLGATATVTLTGDVTGTASFSSNTVTITTTLATDQNDNVEFGTVNISDDFVIASATATTTSTSQTALATFSAATYSSAKITVSAKRGTATHITEVLIAHDGTTAFIIEYGTVTSGSSLFTLDADISTGNVRILVTPSSATSTVFRVAEKLMAV